ncbi:MAG: ferrous iron transport protein B [Rectinemataceae bacterium]
MKKDSDVNLIRVALAGNPNAGKTSIFNAVTGAHHQVGNYPGVTVEKREGSRFRNGREYRFIDLPGIYSLTAYSIDEVVARNFILDEKPDLIVDVLDSTNLERNLFLCLQFQELGIPVVGALNMSDEAAAKGIKIDDKELSSVLGIPMVRTVGSKGSGVESLLDAIDLAISSEITASGSDAHFLRYGDEVESRVQPLETAISADTEFAGRFPARWLAVKLLEKDENAFLRLKSNKDAIAIATRAKESVTWLEKHYAKDAEIVISEQRYGYIRGAVKEAVSLLKRPNFSLTESIDKVIMNRFLALPIFIVILWAVFKLTFVLGAYPQASLEYFFGWLGGAVTSVMPAGVLRSLLVRGIIGGVGSVFSFVPLIIILFFLLSVLEDVGYMSRAAFATDKFLHAFGLHGQSVFPMILGFGCSVPAIMAARTLKSRRDRIVTVLVIPFMSCGAKLPVYVLLAGVFFQKNAANMVMLVYATGAIISLVSALMLKKTILRGDPTPFVMELPPYRAPTLRGLLWHVWEKTWQYIKKAGTVIMAAAILIWAITALPSYNLSQKQIDSLTSSYKSQNPNANASSIESYLGTAKAEASLEHSAAGDIGKFIQPLFAPLGFDWKISVAVVTGFAAKEVIVSTMGILYRVGTEEDEQSQSLRNALRADPHINPLVAFVFMLFVLVIPPCIAALSAIRAELGWGWLGFAFIFMLTLGWCLAAAVYQIGLLAGLKAAI